MLKRPARTSVRKKASKVVRDTAAVEAAILLYFGLAAESLEMAAALTVVASVAVILGTSFPSAARRVGEALTTDLLLRGMRKEGEDPGPPLALPPSYYLRRFATLFPRRTRERVLDPIVEDYVDEYFEALAEDRVWLARWRTASYTTIFLRAVLQRALFSVVEVILRGKPEG